MKYPSLRPDAPFGPPDAHRGFECLLAWSVRDPLAIAVRHFTTDADIRLALHCYKNIIEHLAGDPGPYAQYAAEHSAACALRVMDEIAP